MSNEKKSFQISLAWAERELLRSNSISEPIELQARLRASAHSREIEKIIFSFGIPSIVTQSVELTIFHDETAIVFSFLRIIYSL